MVPYREKVQRDHRRLAEQVRQQGALIETLKAQLRDHQLDEDEIAQVAAGAFIDIMVANVDTNRNRATGNHEMRLGPDELGRIVAAAVCDHLRDTT